MLKTLITYISNYFFSSLDEKGFFNLALFLSLLSKEMLEMEAIRGLCRFEKREEKHEKKHEKHEKHEKNDEKHGEEHKEEQEKKPK